MNMTNLKEVNFGINQYCGPSVLSTLTGESTDRCAAVISAVSGRSEIKAVQSAHLKEALKRLKFDVELTLHAGGTLFGTLHRIHSSPGLYVIFVPHHVVAVEVKDNEIFICDNHTKTPIDIRSSARLMQRVEKVWRVFPHPQPKFIGTDIKVTKTHNNVYIEALDVYESQADNTTRRLGQFTFKNEEEMNAIISELLHLEYKNESS
jgi:hypothetical protein